MLRAPFDTLHRVAVIDGPVTVTIEACQERSERAFIMSLARTTSMQGANERHHPCASPERDQPADQIWGAS